MIRFRLFTIPVALAAFIFGTAQAATFQTLHSPLWIDYWPGFNQAAEFGGGDDVLFDDALHTDAANQLAGQPLNPTGSTGSYHINSPGSDLTMGYFTGSSTTAGNLVFGSNPFTTLQTSFDQNVFNPFGNGADIDEPGNPTTPVVLNAGPFFVELTAGHSNTTTVLPDHSFGSDYVYNDVGFPTSTWRAQTGGWWITNGDDPNVVFVGSPSLAAAFAAAIGALNAQPANVGWTTLALEFGAFWQIDPVTGDPLVNGASGVSSQAYFSLDAGAIPTPVPAALPLMVSALAGFGLVARRRRPG